MVDLSTHDRKQACQRPEGLSPAALGLACAVLVISLIWARGGFAYENSVNAQNQQNILDQTATTQGVGQASVPGGSGLGGPR